MKCGFAFVVLIIASSLHPSYGLSSCADLKAQCIEELQNGKQCKDSILPFPTPNVRAREMYNVETIRPGVHAVSNGVYYVLVVFVRKRLAIVDFPFGGFEKLDENGAVIGSLLNDAILEILDGSIPNRISLVYSHEHTDHIGTAQVTYDFLREEYPHAKIDVFASIGAQTEIKEISSVPLPKVTKLVRSSLTLHLRDVKIELRVVGGHTENDLLIYIPPSKGEKGIGFHVDVIVPGVAPPFFFGLSSDLHEYVAVHHLLLDLDLDIFVGGHLNRLGSKADIERNLEYTQSLFESVQAASQVFTFGAVTALIDGDTPEGRNFGNVYRVVSKVDELVRQQCTIDMVKKWGCILPGVEVTAPSSCTAARFFFQVDT